MKIEMYTKDRSRFVLVVWRPGEFTSYALARSHRFDIQEWPRTWFVIGHTPVTEYDFYWLNWRDDDEICGVDLDEW